MTRLFPSADVLKNYVLPTLGRVHPFFGMTFLALKQEQLPIGSRRQINFSCVNRNFLEMYYRPTKKVARYFTPFRTSGDGWVSLEHSRTTLQRIAADTFGAAFLHNKGTRNWGWATTYLDTLEKYLDGERLPTLALSCWLYRERGVGSRDPLEVANEFLHDFNISKDERTRLFEDRPAEGLNLKWSLTALDEGELLSVLPPAPDWMPLSGASLRRLKVTGVATALAIDYRPTEGLNIVTGDNSLGKTFLLEGCWSALTGEWESCRLVPTSRSKQSPDTAIVYEMTRGEKERIHGSARFSWAKKRWEPIEDPSLRPALVLFARYDGSYAIWDPLATVDSMTFRRSEVWNGVRSRGPDNPLGTSVQCEGALRDLLMWQLLPERHDWEQSTFASCLAALSPDRQAPLSLSEPMRLHFDNREIPTIRTITGDVPIIFASAGIQRMTMLAYMMVWAWKEHRLASDRAGVPPQRRFVIIIDEVEAHLHPRWQRTIVPSLMQAVQSLSQRALPQVHLATHSPLVLASIEPLFEAGRDSLHHLYIDDDMVVIEEIPFVRMGRIDAWLSSPAFDEVPLRSVEAETAIRRATELMLAEVSTLEQVSSAHMELTKVLAQRDPFWIRWLYWAEQQGVET